MTETALKEALSKLNSNKSAGPDNIHARVLKEMAPVIARPLTILFNKCYEEGKIPDDWKRANVTCIFKKGSKSDPGNYRPVSLTSIIGKIAEKFVKNAMYDFLQNQKFFTDNQYGFRTKKSCVTQLIEVMDDLTEYIDNYEDVDIIYLDFMKAFDKVPHERLLKKIQACGIRGAIYNYISNFLNNRQQRVCCNDDKSEWTAVTSGIPQGSILGPLLFIIYINDLPEDLSNNCKMFADDTKLYGPPGDSIQEDLDKIVDWSDKWQLKFNSKKCHTLHLGKKQRKQILPHERTIQ